MVKRYYSKRYTREKRTRYLIIGLILILITLAVVSAYSDIPQLDPIRKQIEPFKIQLQSSMQTPHYIERATIEDIVSNPEAYVNTEKYVSVKGWLGMSLFPYEMENREFCQWLLVDEQKFSIILVPPLPYEDSRAYSINETYRVKGKVTYLNVTTFMRDTKTVIALKPIEMTKL